MRLISAKQAMSFLPMELCLDGGIASIEIKGDIDLDISNPGRNGVTAYFEIEIDGKITSVLYELDKNFDLVSSAYFQINEKNIKESVIIPQAEEERLLKIVQKELEAFMEKMYQTLYGQFVVLDSGELTGVAYTAGKGLFTEIIIPSIKKLQEAIDDIQLELTSYKHADAQVSGYGDLDLDQLKELKKLREEQLAIVEAQIQARENWLNQITDLFSLNWGKAFSEKTILYNAKSQIESGIQDLDDKIEKLEFFVSQVSQYFSDSLEVLRLAIQGATQLSEIIVDSDGNYYADGVDMSWVKKMKEQKIESIKYDSSKKTKDLHKEYQSILDKLEKGKELSDKEFETLESYARRYPKVQLPEIVTNKLTTEAANRANLEKLQEKVEKIKKSDKTSTEKANLIVKAYEDYLFYNNRAAFDEYWKKRKAMDDDWTSKDPNMIKKKEKIEKEFNDSLSNSRINVKEIAQQLGDDVLDVKKWKMRREQN